MNPDIGLDNDSANAWLGGFVDSAAQQLLRPEAFIWIAALLLTIWVLAFIVAAISEQSVAATGGEDAQSFGLTELAGATCMWACPWHPTRTARHSRRRRGAIPVSC